MHRWFEKNLKNSVNKIVLLHFKIKKLLKNGMGGFYASKIGVLASKYITTIDFTYMATTDIFFYIYEIFSQILYPIFFRYLCPYILLWYGPKKRPCYLLCVSTHYFFFLEKSTITRESLWKEKIPCEEMSLEKAYLRAKKLNILNQNWFERESKNIAKTIRHLNNANFS